MTAVALTLIPSRRTAVLPCAADPEAWYDPDHEATAKKACGTCPVRANCLTLALGTDEPWGVWGGYTEVERQRLTAGQQPRMCLTCGLDCVPDRPHHTHCDRCATGPGGRNINDDRDVIARLAADGMTDRQIADRLDWPIGKIKTCRERHNIPSAWANGGGRNRPDSDVKPCGTHAAFRRHKRRGEPVDEACREANERRSADLRAERAAASAGGC